MVLVAWMAHKGSTFERCEGAIRSHLRARKRRVAGSSVGSGVAQVWVAEMPGSIIDLPAPSAQPQKKRRTAGPSVASASSRKPAGVPRSLAAAAKQAAAKAKNKASKEKAKAATTALECSACGALPTDRIC